MYYNFSSDVSGNYNDSISGNTLMHLISSDVFTTSSASVKEYTNQPLQPTSTAAIIESNFNSCSSETLISLMTTFPYSLSDASTLPSNSLSTMPFMNSLVTTDIEPSSSHTSTATIFDSISSDGIILLTTFPEELSVTSTSLSNNPSTVMPASIMSFPKIPSTNRWRCNEGNVTGDSIRAYIFPAIVMEDLRFSLWQDTLQGVSYLYHVNSTEIGCSGTVTEIRFCYKVSLNVHTEEHIFTMSIINSSRHVLKSLVITSTPTNSSGNSTTNNCVNVYNKKYCCDSMDLTDDGSVTFPTSEFILGIETSNSSQVRLQNFRPNVSQGAYNIPILSSFSEINTTGKIATTLPVVRFLICKLHCALVDIQVYVMGV